MIDKTRERVTPTKHMEGGWSVVALLLRVVARCRLRWVLVLCREVEG